MKISIGLLCSMMAFQTIAETNTLIVFDASGSMWGQIDGVNKITIAKSAIETISQGFTQDQVVGLMAYGHRQKGDCSDIELLVSPANGTAAEIVKKSNFLQPKGKTPLSAAVKMAAEQLKYTEHKAEVVLITDGVETCDLDPCAVATELAKTGIDFKAHVIGFGLSADEGKQVSCMADITGGRYVSADDAASLNDALQQVILTPKVSEVEVEIPTATIEAPTEKIVIGAGFTVNWTGPNGENDYLDLVPKDFDKTFSELSYQWTKKGMPSSMLAPGKPGFYDLRYIWVGPKNKHVLAKVTIEVVESEVSLVTPKVIGIGEFFSVEWKGPNNPNDYVDLVKKDYQETMGELSYFYTKEGTPGTIQAPAIPGFYELRYVLQAIDGRQVLYKTPIEISETAVTLAFNPHAEVASGIDVFWTGPNNKEGYIDIVPADYQDTYGEISYFYLKDSDGSGVLMAPVDAGQFQVRFIMEGAEGRQVLASQTITVSTVPASLELSSTAQAGTTISVNWQGPNRRGDYVDLMPADNNDIYGELSYFYTNSEESVGTLTVPDQPGQYKVRYVLQGSTRKVLTEKTLTVQ